MQIMAYYAYFSLIIFKTEVRSDVNRSACVAGNWRKYCLCFGPPHNFRSMQAIISGFAFGHTFARCVWSIGTWSDWLVCLFAQVAASFRHSHSGEINPPCATARAPFWACWTTTPTSRQPPPKHSRFQFAKMAELRLFRQRHPRFRQRQNVRL